MELWGEDALLQWPGARRPLIQERDAYMARTIWAAASGKLLPKHEQLSSGPTLNLKKHFQLKVLSKPVTPACTCMRHRSGVSPGEASPLHT